MSSTGNQPTSAVAAGPIARARGAGDQLRPEADTEQGHACLEGGTDERGLAGEPRMLRVLVGVHRAPEDHDRVVRRRVGLVRPVRRHPALVRVPGLDRDRLEQPAAARP